MERKIGEIFEYNGEWYQCVVAIQGCRECSFRTHDYCTHHLECLSDTRSDKTSVIFKKLEKVGEPTILMDKMVQEFKNNNDNYCEYCCFNKDCHPLEIASICDLHNSFFVELKQTKEDMEEKGITLDDAIKYCSDAGKHSASIDCKIINYKIRDWLTELKQYKDKEHFNSESTEKDLKPFSLEAAKAGKPVCTRDGRKARILCFDRFCCDEISTIVACVLSEDGKDENVIIYSSDGFMVDKQHPYADDLMMLPEKKEGWVNVYKDGLLDTKSYPTRKEAFDKACPENYVDTIKISWEE